ncbi:MAG TPA: hypothetical protein PLL64_12930 [Rhodothermales bacterium]|nr:hypothetical protein [Rhodothermales bacterium]HRR07892.1 hypothetical protein [Rhodothermales bacterium]
MPALDLFRTYITGDFDNRQQVERERKNGTPEHPFARHINRLADEKLRNAPSRNGFWLIEESYYTYPDGSDKINHHLFFFEGVNPQTVRLYAYQLPESLPMAQLTHDNPALSIDFSTLQVSPRFAPAEYTLTDGQFTLHAPNDWGNGMRFTLSETIGKDRLHVMELLEKDGQRLTPYSTPIEYDRI